MISVSLGVPSTTINQWVVQQSYMCVNSQQYEHREKADSPELRQRHHSCSLRVGNEDQTWTYESDVYMRETFGENLFILFVFGPNTDLEFHVILNLFVHLTQLLCQHQHLVHEP